MPNRTRSRSAIHAHPRVLSVGYEGRTAESLVDEMSNYGVALVVDVRQNPISRKAGLSKSRLSASLTGRGIRYIHMRSLGNPKDNRAGFYANDPTEARRTFRELIDNDADALRDLATLANEARVGTIALICFERSAHNCHRSVVIEALQMLLDEAEVLAIE